MKDLDPADSDKRPDDHEVGIDTSKMSPAQREAMEVAEAARDRTEMTPGFAQELFMGRFAPDLIAPFPLQGEEDKRIGDEMIDSLSSYLETHLDPEAVDETREIPQDVVDELIRRGVFAMKIPKQYDGLGFSQVNYNRVMMMIASYCGSTAVLVSAHQSIGVPQPLKLFGTAEQKRKYLPRFRNGAISAFALTEPNVGSDPAQMATTATPSEDGSHFVITGEKLWCTNGTIADVIVVMAKTPPKLIKGRERTQITAFIVETDTPGFEVVHRCDFMGIRGIQNGLLRFNNVKVPRENILWGEGKGLKLALITLNTGRLTLPAACAGMAKQCLSISRRWGKARKQWGAPIGLHEAGRSKIASMAADTLAMEAVAFLTSHWADCGDIDIRIEAAMAKLFCSETAWRIIDDTLQLRGGRGYEKASSLKERGEPGFGVERMMRDCRINRIIEGTTEVMKLFLAREAMDPHLKLAAELFQRDAPAGRKLKASGRMAAFYAVWYPRQWINAGLWQSYSQAGPFTAEFRYLERNSRKLARAIFHSMGRYREKLEKRQNTLGRLMEIGTELFAMAATCSYARALSERESGDRSAVDLAKLFCQQSQLRIRQRFDGLHRNTDRFENAIAKRVLEGEYGWLEKGIIESEPGAYREEDSPTG